MSSQKRKHLRKGKAEAVTDGIVREKPPKPPKPSMYMRPMFWIVLVLGMGILISGGNVYRQYNHFLLHVDETLDVEGIYPGVRVDGLDLGGMSREEARDALIQLHKPELDRVGVTLSLDGEELVSYDSTQVDITHDMEDILDKAMEAGRTGDRFYRYNYVVGLAEKPLQMKVTYTVDPSPLEKGVRGAAAYLSQDAQDAKLLGLNPNADPTAGEPLFTVEPEVPGRVVEGDELWKAVLKEFENKTYGTVEITYYQIDPAVVVADVTQDVQLLAHVETTMTKDPNRIHNIQQACAAINGLAIQPGETFSYNECLGPRTADNGYLEAGVITNGRSDTGMGGGICQVSSMVFVAAVKSDFAIVERNRHSYVLSYIDAGCDATVDYGNLDLRITNTKETPVYIRAWTVERQIFVEMYGTPRSDGLQADIRTRLMKRYTPGDPVVKKDGRVPVGAQEVSAAHNGCKVKVYRVYLNAAAEEQEEMTELLHEDYYPPLPKEIRVNPADFAQYSQGSVD